MTEPHARQFPVIGGPYDGEWLAAQYDIVHYVKPVEMSWTETPPPDPFMPNFGTGTYRLATWLPARRSFEWTYQAGWMEGIKLRVLVDESFTWRDGAPEIPTGKMPGHMRGPFAYESSWICERCRHRPHQGTCVRALPPAPKTAAEMEAEIMRLLMTPRDPDEA